MTRKLSNLIKRLFDILFAAIGLVLLSPVFLLIAALIKRDSPGPAFYWGPRLGRNGRVFGMLKFRTMYEDPKSYAGPRLTSSGDPRITPLGGWLRDTKINELPQLWNVLIGDMSFVGPRPEDPELAKNWPDDARPQLLSIRPGITSPASILYHDEEKLLSQKDAMSEYFKSILPDKLRLDLLYVHHHKFFSDLDTIFWTLAIFVPRWTKTKIPVGYLFAGPISRLFHRFVSWFMIDLVEALAVVSLVAFIWHAQVPMNWGTEYIVALAFVLAFLFSGFNSIVGLNRIVWSQATAGDVFGLVASSWVVTFVVMFANYLEGRYQWLKLEPLSASMIVIISLILQVAFIVTRYRFRLVTFLASRWLTLRQNQLAMGDRLLIVGDGEGSQIAQWLLGRQMFRAAFSIIGMVNDDDPAKYGMRVNGCWMLGSVSDVPELIKKHDIGVVLSTVTAGASGVNEYLFNLRQRYKVRLIFLTDLLRMVERQVTQPIRSYEYPFWEDEKLEFKAMHDAVTNLPNRFLFQAVLKRSLAYARRYQTCLAVLFITLDELDTITENFSCKFGDQVLIKVMERINRLKRESDTLARVGETRFALILENIQDETVAENVIKRIAASLSEPMVIEKQKFDIKTSINIYLDKGDYDALEASCGTELGFSFAVKQPDAIGKQYEQTLAR